jgi:phosphoadenosine phosphosulfate reductase
MLQSTRAFSFVPEGEQQMLGEADMTDSRTGRWSAQLEGQSPVEILAWTARRFPSRVAFGTGFGPEGCVLIHLIAEQGLAIDVFTLDTGLLFPETIELWQRLETRYGLRIRGVRPALSPDEQAAAYGEALWARDPDRCCGLRKVAPLQRQLTGIDAWITAIRRDQTPARARAAILEHDADSERVKVNPLLEWTSSDVWSFIHANDVPYNLLHERGYPSVGCMPCTTAVAADEDPRAGRWRGREKTECGLHAAIPVPLQLILSRS